MLLSPRKLYARREWLRRLDRVAGDLNVLLVLIAIGLATIDATMLFSQRLIASIPQVTRVVDAPSPGPSPK